MFWESVRVVIVGLLVLGWLASILEAVVELVRHVVDYRRYRKEKGASSEDVVEFGLS